MSVVPRARARRAPRRLALLLGWLQAMLHAPAASPARADAPPLPSRLRLSIEPCSRAPFVFDEYLRLLRVELTALGVVEVDAARAEVDATVAEPVPEVIVTWPDCAEQLVLRLVYAERAHEEAVRSSELPVPGRERALALVTVERMQRAWAALAAELREPSEPSEPSDPSDPSEPAVPKPATTTLSDARTTAAPPRSASSSTTDTPGAEGHGALSVGLRFSTDAPLASLGLSLDRSLSRALAVGGALGWRGEHAGLAADTDAHGLTAGPRLELLLVQLDLVELAAAVGLGVGVAWVVTARADGGARVSSSPAPLGLATGMLGLRARIAHPLFLQSGVTTDFALLGARFETRSGRRLASFTGARFTAFVGVGTRLGP